MMKLLVNVLLATTSLYFYVFSVSAQYINSVRERVQVSEKKHILAEHVKGFDTYDHPIDYMVNEQFILRFKDKNGYFNVSRSVYDMTEIGNKFIVQDNELYYCTSSDACHD